MLQEIEQATARCDDWGHLNALIGSKEGDKFRKFAQGLTLDNLVWLANNQLTRLHGRYLLKRKASEALELEVVDTGRRTPCAIRVRSPAAKVSGQSGAGAGVVRSGESQNPHRFTVPRRGFRHTG